MSPTAKNLEKYIGITPKKEFIAIPTRLNEINIIDYAKIIGLHYSEIKADVEKISIITETLSILTGVPQTNFINKYKVADVVNAYNKVMEMIGQPLPEKPKNNFVFTTITDIEKEQRLNQIKKVKNIFKRRSIKNDLEIDCNRHYKLILTNQTTFQQFILSEEIAKKTFTDIKRIEIKDFENLINILSYVYFVDGNETFKYNEQERKFLFNMDLINRQKKIFRKLDIVTAYSLYLGFFLTERGF